MNPVKKLLVIDDSTDDLALYQRTLRGYPEISLHMASSGAAGRAALTEVAPDLILLDYNLPDMDGLALLKWFREAHPAYPPPIIMLTGEGNEDLAVAALKAGAADYLVKHVDGRHLKLLPDIIARTLEDHARSLAQQAAELQLQLAANILSNISEGVIVTTPGGNIVSVNPAFCQITGFATEELLGCNPRILNSGRHEKDFYQGLWHAIEQEGYWQGEIWNRCKDGSLLLVRETITAIRDNRGVMQHYVGVVTDITDAKRSEESIRHRAYHDALTELPNRALLMDRLRHHLAFASRHRRMLAVLFVDLDGFKAVNDDFGHDVGDEVLKEAARRLKGCVRESDTLARLGGDEFVAVLNDITALPDAAGVAQKMIKELTALFPLPGGIRRNLSASIGIALYPSVSCDALGLLNAADEAMYVAKKNGKAAFFVAASASK